MLASKYFLWPKILDIFTDFALIRGKRTPWEAYQRYCQQNVKISAFQKFKASTRHSRKPECIIDYNRNMGSVDKQDQLLEPYSATRKSTKWYKKLAFHLLQLAMLNSHLLPEVRQKKNVLTVWARRNYRVFVSWRRTSCWQGGVSCATYGETFPISSPTNIVMDQTSSQM